MCENCVKVYGFGSPYGQCENLSNDAEASWREALFRIAQSDYDVSQYQIALFAKAILGSAKRPDEYAMSDHAERRFESIEGPLGGPMPHNWRSK